MHAILKSQLFTYFRTEDFRGKRLLDFGCGIGASTLGIAKMLPESEVVGVELIPEKIEMAKTIAALQKVGNAKFLCSPLGDRVPDEIGQFDYVILCAVYEHLLPRERETLMPLLWSAMNEGGAIFINQTPYRYFPFEHHSTGLWFVNYMPDSLAHFVARKFARHDPTTSRAVQTSPLWEDHLRGGIRGATEWEIIRNLTRASSSKARILQPRAECARDRADYWFQKTGQKRFPLLKRALASIFRVTDKFLGTLPSMNVDVVIQKEPHLKGKRTAPEEGVLTT
jgi:SAM-dependent methyltransferase